MSKRYGEGTQLGQLTQTGQRNIPHHRTWRSARKTIRGRRRRIVGGCLPSWPLLKDWLGIRLLVGDGKWFPLRHLFFLFLPHLLTWFLSQSKIFLTFVLPVNPQPPWWKDVDERVAVWLLSCWQGSANTVGYITYMHSIYTCYQLALIHTHFFFPPKLLTGWIVITFVRFYNIFFWN